MMFMIISVVLLNSAILPFVNGHGMMMDPPGRASRWRHGFNGPKHYTDNELNCGGRHVQWNKHGGKCGVCGDVYGTKNPKFVHPGKYARNAPIVKTYTEGQEFTVTIKITTNHKGFFVFSVGRLENPPIQEQDLSLIVRSPTGEEKWDLTSSRNTDFKIPLKLPKGFTCEHCVFRWRWFTGNNYINNTPETFVNCADIRIVSRGGRPNPPTTPHTTQRPTTAPPATGKPTEPGIGGSGCTSIGGREDMDTWCQNNCAAGYCPASLCKCD